EVDDPSTGNGLLALHRRVRHRGVAGAHGDGDPEARLERRLVEAGKDPPGVRRLALREGVPPAIRAGGVEPAEMLVQRTREAEHQHGVAGRKRTPETERDRLVRALDLHARGNLEVRGTRDGALDREVGGVQHDVPAWTVEADGDADVAA